MSATDPSALALFWLAVIGLAILAYVVLDGFDLGVGILFGVTKDEALRDEMIASISPFWDGNETWLIVVGATLFAAFPAVYAVFLGAFYIPVLLLLLTDIPRRRVRIPRSGRCTRILGSQLRCWLARCGLCPRRCGRSHDPRNTGRERPVFRRLVRLGRSVSDPARDRPRACLCAARSGLVGP